MLIFMHLKTQLYIDGKWIDGASTMPVTDPSDESVIANVQVASDKECAQAVDAAAKAFKSWSKTAPRVRAEILRKAFEIMVAESDRLAEIISKENGKVLSDAKGEILYAAEFFRWFAEEAVLSEDRVIAIPDQLSDGQGATFMQSYLTAWFAFHKRAQVREGATMLVLGAGGGVGLAAVDLGVAMGMRVIAAASSPEKRQLALDRGAFAAIDVLNEDVKLRTRELCGGGVDMVYDPVGGELAEPCLRALAPFGQYLVVGFVGGIPRLPANHVLLTNRTVVGVDWGAWVGRNIVENQGMLVEVLAGIASGKLHPVEPVMYPMSQAVQAMRDLQDRKIAGKVALIPQFD